MLEKLKANAAIIHKMASVWVMSAASAGGAIWFGLTPEQQAAALAALPIPGWSVPIGLGVIGTLARVWPQKSITPAQAENKSAE